MNFLQKKGDCLYGTLKMATNALTLLLTIDESTSSPLESGLVCDVIPACSRTSSFCLGLMKPWAAMLKCGYSARETIQRSPREGEGLSRSKPASHPCQSARDVSKALVDQTSIRSTSSSGPTPSRAPSMPVGAQGSPSHALPNS